MVFHQDTFLVHLIPFSKKLCLINPNGNITTQGTITAIYTFKNVDTELDLKANQSTTYTKTELDTELSKKANTADMSVAFALKPDKTYVDNHLALKAKQSTTYTNAEVDTALGLNANQLTTYTKTEVDSLVSPKS